MAQDRLYIDRKRQDEIRGIMKNKDYLPFDNNKDLFMYALSIGTDLYTGGVLDAGKEGFFLIKDMDQSDYAFMYAVVAKELDSIEELTDLDKVLAIAEGIADKGFTMILEDIKNLNSDTMVLTTLDSANKLFEEELREGYFSF